MPPLLTGQLCMGPWMFWSRARYPVESIGLALHRQYGVPKFHELGTKSSKAKTGY